ncbi:hypothetical protein JL09_g6674 [Pichia kudriavzevii]|uniref:Uncharacterized protein n=1 Tax=Pichia kudriavzevii TaxID=4909 RepID=A0A099NKU4_PICKU|nr:hypothetical protein JL09_g6674 [Pichia kudriavzevii]
MGPQQIPLEKQYELGELN